ncbi:hypothetical protein [Actinomadura welshii]|uniref:hypothetical protein n=1 Tax=Actinomadura welshii TaxID=3103817 RepID=UPI0003AD5699|nr:hypothetical protein [Actinomadura madurae]
MPDGRDIREVSLVGWKYRQVLVLAGRRIEDEVPVPQVDRPGGEKKQRNLRRIAAVIEKALGDQALSTFADPPSALFAKGVGQVSFAKFVGSLASDKAALLHVRTHSTSGQQVDLCLFGSLGWSSSASQAIEELLQSHGRQNSSQWEDEESRAVEAKPCWR